METVSTLKESRRVCMHLMAGADARAAVEILQENYPDAKVENHPAYVTVERDGSLSISVSEISDRLGKDYDVPTFLVVLSSYIGRIEVDDDTVTLRSEILAKRK